MPSKLVTDCAQALSSKGLKIAFIESATAGHICSEFSLTPSSGEILRGGICCYEIFVKEQILHVSRNLIEKYTAESAEVTEALAKGGFRLFNAPVTVAVTGLTSPGGSETREKPVGTMFIHIIAGRKIIAHREVFEGTPESILQQTVEKVAELILQLEQMK